MLKMGKLLGFHSIEDWGIIIIFAFDCIGLHARRFEEDTDAG